MKLTFEERKELADLVYFLGLAFYNYKNNKRLNLLQKRMLNETFKMLNKILEENGKQLLTSGKMSEYFNEIYGVKL